jgi:nitrate reductase assembly molybdenum cofactor insertion protein NarJ
MMNLKIETVDLLREATDWRLLALLLSCPGPGWWEEVSTLAKTSVDAQLRQAVACAHNEASPARYHTTFGPGGPVSPREVSYQQTMLSGRFLAELLDYYAAFAYGLPTDEPPDHVATETDFVGYLRLKEAFASSRLDTENAKLTALAAREFLTNHLSMMAEPLALLLERSDIQYLKLAGASLLQRVGSAPLRSPCVGPDDEAATAWQSCSITDGCGCGCVEAEAITPKTSEH